MSPRLLKFALAALTLALGISIALVATLPARIDGQRYLGMTWRDISSIDSKMIYEEAKRFAYKEEHHGLWTKTLQVNFAGINGEQWAISATSKRRILLFGTAWIGNERSDTKDAVTHYLEVWLLGRIPLP